MALELEFNFPGSYFGAQCTKLKTCPQKDFREVCHPEIVFAYDGD